MIDREATPNILKANFIEDFSITKNFSDGTRQFDIIMGNPPFQGTGRKKIYITFIDVIFKKNLKTSGYLIFITPTLSLDFLLGIEITQKKLEKFYNIIYFNSSNKIKEDFFHNIGSDFSYFKIKNEAYKYKTQLILNNGDIEDNYKLEWNKKLNLQNIKYTKIIEKICNYENNLGIWVRKAARLTSNKDGSDLSTTESKQFKNKIVFKIHTTDEEYRWTDRTHMDFDKKKILYPTLGERILVDKKGHLFPGTSFTPYILCNNDLECDFLKKFIESNVMKFLKKINPNARSPLDEVLKRLKKNTKYKLPKKITDKDIYKYYKLSPKEITLIEAVGDGTKDSSHTLSLPSSSEVSATKTLSTKSPQSSPPISQPTPTTTTPTRPGALSTTSEPKKVKIRRKKKKKKQQSPTLVRPSALSGTSKPKKKIKIKVVSPIRPNPLTAEPKPKSKTPPTLPCAQHNMRNCKKTGCVYKRGRSPKCQQTGGKRNIYTKIYDPISKIYVSVFSKKGGNLIKKYSRQSNKKTNQKGGRNYNKIYNPVSKKFVKLNSSLGLKILQKYLK
tara:strand:- start:171 stop:1844 length:1674 start_codon:yes stop_codon:yes gene_type:complete